MADKDFRIDLILGAKFAEAFRALDGAKRKIEDVDKSAGNFSRRAGTAVGTGLRASATAAVVAATAATAVMGLYIAKTIEAEKVQAQLQSRLADTANVAGRSLEQLNQQAANLQKITIFDDEAIGNAQAMLLTFTQIRGLNFDGAIEASLDLATVMGTDASSAAKILGKALSDPEKGLAALTKAGVTFTDAERTRIEKMLEGGRVAEAQAVILEKLRGTMGTAAEAARDTLGGALQALKNSFDNLLEGDTGDAGIKGTRTAIESLISTLDEPATKAAFDSIVGAIVTTTNALISGTSWWIKWGEARGVALSGGDISGTSDAGAQKRLDEIANQLGRLARPYELAGKTLDTTNPLVKSLLDERDGIIEQLKERNRSAYRSQQAALARAGVDAGFDFLTKPDPKPEGQGTPTPAKAGKASSKSDPDADIKRRIESLREEATLLGGVKEGEERASEAAKVRYAITEGEFKKKSPQLQQELLQAAEALDAANADVEAKKKLRDAIKESEDAYKALRLELRTPAEVAVDDAIAKLNTLNEAMQRGDTGGPALDDAQRKIVDRTFEKSPDFGLGAFNPLEQFEEQRQQLDAWYQSQLSMLAAFRQQRADLSAQWNAQEESLEAQHQAAMQQLQSAQAQVMLGAASSMFGSLAEIARAGAGEQSKAYRVLFAISKGFAIAQAAVALAQNIAEASKIGFPQNLPMIAGAFAQGAQIASILAGANYSGGSGYAEGGYTGPGGKYQPAGIVHKGEGVLSQEEISALGGPAGFYRLRALIDEGAMRERMYGWAGYAAGGLVGASGPALTPPDYASYPQGAAGLTSNVANNMSLYLLQDRAELARAMANHPDVRKAIVAEICESGQTVRASWGI